MNDLEEAVSLCAKKWLFFKDTFVFNEEVELKKQIMLFSNPMSGGLRNSFKSMKAAPEALLLMTIAMGVVASGTHTKEQVEDALSVKF